MLDRLLSAGDSTEQAVRLVAVCEPHPEQFPQRVEMLSRRGIALVRDFGELLAAPIEGVYLPLPIGLHRSFTERALGSAKVVLCEKPAAGSVADVDAMIAARDRAGRAACIGFMDVYQPAVQAVKRRMVAGEFGKLREARVIGCWPRGEKYYGRADWAGKLRHGGAIVMDTPANNAFAHFIHLAMFLLGGEGVAARPTGVEAELYRVNPIETYDTCVMRVAVEGGVRMMVGLSHACATSVEPEVTVITERARIRYVHGRTLEIFPAGAGEAGEAPERLELQLPLHEAMFSNFRDHVRGGPRAAEVGTLEMARVQAEVVAAAWTSGKVTNVREEFTRVVSGGENAGRLRVIEGVEAALTRCVEEGVMLRELGTAAWARGC
jgi:predicted dehydrogenase